jgi:hypothetical protein
MPCNDND